MTVSKENYLTGKCLVSMPNMQDERFADTLIYICSHSKDGAMGFVVNKKIKEFPLPTWPNQLPINTLRPIEAIDLHQGGPLEKCAALCCTPPIMSKKTLSSLTTKLPFPPQLTLLPTLLSAPGRKTI